MACFYDFSLNIWFERIPHVFYSFCTAFPFSLLHLINFGFVSSERVSHFKYFFSPSQIFPEHISHLAWYIFPFIDTCSMIIILFILFLRPAFWCWLKVSKFSFFENDKLHFHKKSLRYFGKILKIKGSHS